MEILFTKDRLPYAAYTVAVVTEQTKRVNFKFVESLPLGAAQDAKNGITGNGTLAFFLAKYAASKQLPSGSVLTYGIENASAEEANMREAQVQQWLEFAAAELSGQDLASLDKPAQYLNYVLQNSSFLTGNRLTVADLVVYEALKINKQTKSVFVRFNDKKAKRNVYDLQRWFAFLDQFVERHLAVLVDAQKKKVGTLEIMKILEEEQLKKQKQSKQKTLGSGELEGDVDLVLPYVSLGNVITRFPPEPSGFLHIGHAKAAMLNNFFANKYGGKVLLRFDDTNPAKEKSEYEEAIKEDLKKLKIQSASLTYTSDYFGKLVELAEQMLKAGKAYADDTPREQFKQEKFEGIESKNRNNSIEKNMQMWEEMLKGTEYGRQCVLRAKIDMKHENKTMRDPVMFRCKPEHHARTGDSFKCYPTYDFACPVVDSVEGVTHALRTSEYNDRNAQYYWFIDALGIRKPYLWDYSRMGFEYTVMSKRKLQKLVDIGAVDGWDDPRFPTVQGLIRRGLTIEALTKFVLDQGASRNSATLEWNKLWVFNKQIIDPVVPRFTAIDAEGLVPFEIADGPAEIEIRQVPKHKKNASLGVKNVQYSNVIYFDAADANAIEEGEEVTVMDWGNAIVKKVIKESGKVTKLEGVLNLKGSVKTTKKKLTWLAATNNLVDIETIFYGQLLNKKKVEKGDNFDDLINKKSKLITFSKGDPNLKDLKKGEIIQLERRGYFICDVPYNPETKKLTLFNIPDGSSNSIEAQKQ